MKKIVSLTVVLVLCVVALFGCAPAASTSDTSAAADQTAAGDSSAEATQATAAAADKGVIGFTNCTQDSPFYGVLCDTAVEEAEKAGYKMIAIDAQSDIEKQNNDVTDLINQGVDCIIINPVDPDGVAPSMKACEDAGIPVFTVDRPVEGECVAHVGRDNELMGEMAGQVALDLLGGEGKASGRVLEVMGAAGCKVMKARSAGFHNIMDSESGVEVVQTPYTEYTRSIAVTAVTDILQSDTDFDVIYSHCDDCGVGALKCFTDAGLTDVKVVAIDGLREAVEMIADPDSNYTSTTVNDPVVLAQKLVSTVIGYLETGSVDSTFIDVGTQLITKANAQAYLDASDATFVATLSDEEYAKYE